MAGAVLASLCVHTLLLTWLVSLPAQGGDSLSGTESRAPAKLRVSFAQVAQEEKVEKAPPIPAALEEKVAQAPPSEPVEQKEIALVGYYPAARLTKMPQAIGVFDVQPPPGGDTGIGGKVTIRVWIGANGAIDRSQVVSNGLPQGYAEAALAAFDKMRFEAGEIGDVRVRSWVEIVIEYADFRDDPPNSGASR